jgi:hypothetical protein
MLKCKKGDYMKKILFVVIFTISYQLAFSQSEAIKFLSMGFNASSDSGGGNEYFFFGYEGYSEAFIYNSSIRLSTGEPETFFPNGLITYLFSPYKYYRYNGKNNSIGYENHVATIGNFGEEHKFENGRLVYWALTDHREPYLIAERIEQNNQSITVFYSDSRGNYESRYYNIPKNELLDIFLKKYVWIICEASKMVNEYSNVNEIYNEIVPLIEGRTARELAIFRNCLYAIKGYRFANSTWTDFFNKYLEGYRGQFSNDEVTAKFTNNDKWLLNLVSQHENGR